MGETRGTAPPKYSETLGPYRTPAVTHNEPDAEPVTYRYRRIERTAHTAAQARVEFQYRVRGMWWWRKRELYVTSALSLEDCEEVVRRWVWLMSREGEG